VYRERNALAAVMTMVFMATSTVACGDDLGTPVMTAALADAIAPTTVAPAAPPSPLPTTPAPTTSETPAVATTTDLAPIEVTVTGVVVSVDGTLSATNSFTIRLEDGSDLTLVPIDGLLFGGVSPLSHVRDHLVSGSPVLVTYTSSFEGSFLAIEIGDAGGGENSHGD
jgi:hypothetical protein